MKRRHAALLLAPAALGLPGCMRIAYQGYRQLTAAPAVVHPLRWTDAARGRDLPLRLRLPAEGSGPLPLVLFSHGLGGSLDAGTLWAEAWAQAGIATLHLQHPGSDTEVLRQGGIAGLRAAASLEQLAQRCADLRFVLDELARRQPAEPALLGRLKLSALGVAGHSFGARTALAVAGQADPLGRATGVDPRPRAFAAFSPAPGEGPLAARAFAGVTRPVLCLTGSLDADPLASGGVRPERAERGDWRRAVYDALPASDKAELWLADADHGSFAGRDAPPRTGAAREPAERHRALIVEASTLWWRAQLLDDGGARRALQRGPAGLQPADDWRRSG